MQIIQIYTNLLKTIKLYENTLKCITINEYELPQISMNSDSQIPNYYELLQGTNP